MKQAKRIITAIIIVVMVISMAMVTSAASGKWKKDSRGWWYSYTSGGYAANKWEYIGGKWYHFNSKGYMQTGWLKDGSKWYYLGNDGAMITGWQKASGKWYYMDSSGAMQTGWIKDSGKWYYLAADGAMATGWVKSDGKWYHMDASGAMQTGWQKISGKWYYFKSSGIMVTGTQTIGGKQYTFGSDGVWQESSGTPVSGYKAAYAQVVRNYQSTYTDFSWFFDYSDLPSSANNHVDAFMELVDFDHDGVPELIIAYGVPGNQYGYLDVWTYKNGQASLCTSLSKYMVDMMDTMHIHISYYSKRTCLLVQDYDAHGYFVLGFDQNGTFRELYKLNGPSMTSGYPYNYSVDFGEGYAYKNEIIPIFLWGPDSKNEVLKTINETKSALGLR